MKIKNNSQRSWDEYNCGGEIYVTIPAGSVIEVDDGVGAVLLRALGSEKWLTIADKKDKVTFADAIERRENVEAEKKQKKEKKEKPAKKEKKPKKEKEVVEEIIEVIEEVIEEEAPVVEEVVEEVKESNSK